MRKVAVIIGSKSDLPQCYGGFEFLNNCSAEIEVDGVYIRSQHRNTLETQELLRELVERDIDVIITGAGRANHLTGCTDAFLRYTLADTKIVVFGVAFEGGKNEMHTLAAKLSISEVPGTQVVYKDKSENFIGSNGFMRACVAAATTELPSIKQPEPKPPIDMNLFEAMKSALEQR